MKYNIKTYPDGSKYVQVEEFSDYLVYRINSYEDLWILNQIKDVCDHNKVKVNLFIPSILDAQADRRFNSNESSGLKLVCQFIDNLNFERVTVFHPHNSEVIEALIRNVRIVDNLEFIKKVLNSLNVYNEVIENKRLDEKFILMSTDAGGFKPLIKLADNLSWKGDTFSASKSRKYENNKSTLVQQVDKEDFEGKNILIVDDICVKGGTFIGLANLLKEKNCGKIYLAVSHITVENPNPLIFELFDKVFTTNSKGLTYISEMTEKGERFGTVPKNIEIVNID